MQEALTEETSMFSERIQYIRERNTTAQQFGDWILADFRAGSRFALIARQESAIYHVRVHSDNL